MPKGGKKTKRPGTSPGSLFYTREKVQENVSIQLICYNDEEINVSNEQNIANVLDQLDKTKVNWININGLHDASVIESIGNYFGIHPLVLEDVLHTEHMPKLEDYDDYLFLTLKMLTYKSNDRSVEAEHVSLILGKYYVISFQEKDGDVFDKIREHLLSAKGRLRKLKADYLFYRLMDSIVDHYFLITEKIEGNLDQIEEVLLKRALDGVSEHILNEKKNLIFLRRNILPLREESGKFRQKSFQLIQENTYGFFDDVRDHLIHLSQVLDGFRDLIASLMELQMSVNSNKMNSVMKTLTIFAAVFMPLTFLAGIYGMNFRYMPELEWRWGYPLVLIAMGLIAISLLIFMKRRKWL